jgi:hypothetical protein
MADTIAAADLSAVALVRICYSLPGMKTDA